MAAKKNASARAPRPGFCGRYARRRLAENMSAIADTLVEHATGGSVPHTKMLVQLTELDRKGVRRPAGRSAAAAKAGANAASDSRPGLREALLRELARQAKEDEDVQQIG